MTGQLHIEGLFENADELWENVLAALRRLPSRRSQAECLHGSRVVALDAGQITVSLPEGLSTQFVEKRCHRAVVVILNRLTGKPFEVRFVAAPAASASGTGPAADAPDNGARRTARPALTGQPLNPRYTFDTFASGESNAFACRAALAVAAQPGGAYNPLVLCGGVGVGKTHLLQAIGHEIARAHPGLRLAHVTADAFTYEFVTAIRERRCDAFRKRYRQADVWLVDDIQFVAQKESTEEEFFLTFTALQEAGHQIVVTSDRYPREVQFLEARLRSRLESGLIVEVGSPDLETRVRILRRKAEAEGMRVSDDVLLFVANSVQSNVRTLEGALIKLLAYSSLTRRPLTESVARDVLEGYSGKHAAPTITVEMIQRAICDFYHVDLKALTSKRRDRAVVLPRQVAMYLARQVTEAPLTDIGHRFGGRDHSTVIAACKKIESSLPGDGQLRDAVAEISRRLGLDG